MRLADLQARFADALLTGKEDAMVSLLDDTGLPPTALLDIYRASIFASRDSSRWMRLTRSTSPLAGKRS